MKEIKEGILYIALHNQLLNAYGESIIHRKELMARLGRGYQIPRAMKCLVIKELIEKNMIQKINRDEYEILKVVIDLEKDEKKLYKLAGIY